MTPYSQSNGASPITIYNVADICMLYSRVPDGLEDVSTFPALIAHLIDGGWEESEIKALLGNNLLRVFEAVEKVC